MHGALHITGNNTDWGIRSFSGGVVGRSVSQGNGRYAKWVSMLNAVDLKRVRGGEMQPSSMATLSSSSREERPPPLSPILAERP